MERVTANGGPTERGVSSDNACCVDGTTRLRLPLLPLLPLLVLSPLLPHSVLHCLIDHSAASSIVIIATAKHRTE